MIIRYLFLTFYLETFQVQMKVEETMILLQSLLGFNNYQLGPLNLKLGRTLESISLTTVLTYLSTYQNSKQCDRC
jgi:hypothetical protein